MEWDTECRGADFENSGLEVCLWLKRKFGQGGAS